MLPKSQPPHRQTWRSGQRRAFLLWAVVLTAVWAFANGPRTLGGSLKPPWVYAGLPWPFAHWDGRRLEWFKPEALAADVAVWVALMLVAWRCAWSRCRSPRS